MNNIKSYLSSTGQTVAEFAAKADISEAALYKYMSGERQPRKKHFNKMVSASEGVLDANIIYALPHSSETPNINKG